MRDGEKLEQMHGLGSWNPIFRANLSRLLDAEQKDRTH